MRTQGTWSAHGRFYLELHVVVLLEFMPPTASLADSRAHGPCRSGQLGVLFSPGSGTTLVSSKIQPSASNLIYTSVVVRELERLFCRYTLEQSYECSFCGNRCCVETCKATATGARLDSDRTTWECYGAPYADACQD